MNFIHQKSLSLEEYLQKIVDAETFNKIKEELLGKFHLPINSSVSFSVAITQEDYNQFPSDVKKSFEVEEIIIESKHKIEHPIHLYESNLVSSTDYSKIYIHIKKYDDKYVWKIMKELMAPETGFNFPLDNHERFQFRYLLFQER